MMGTIVINQTDCKQNVVLQSSQDGISGGYYDAAGVWHEIGAGTEIPEITPVIGKTLSATTGEESVNTARAYAGPFPVTPSSDGYTLQSYAPAGYKAALRAFYQESFISNADEMYTCCSPSLFGDTGNPWNQAAFINISGCVIGSKKDGTWHLYTDNIDELYFVYEKDDTTSNTSAADFDGYVVVNGVVYHIIGE